MANGAAVNGHATTKQVETAQPRGWARQDFLIGSPPGDLERAIELASVVDAAAL